MKRYFAPSIAESKASGPRIPLWRSFVLGFCTADAASAPRRTTMKFQGFLHLNIRCSKRDLPAIEKFSGDVLGLQAGFRATFQCGGLGLYDGEDPIIHVGARFPEGSIIKDKHSGSVDHIAFKASGAADFRKRLKKIGSAFA